MSVLFAATYPDRITNLVLYGSFAKIDPAPDYFPETQGEHDAFLDRIYRMVDSWGQGTAVDIFAPASPGAPLFAVPGRSSSAPRQARRWSGPS